MEASARAAVFNAAFFQTQHAAFSGRCGGRSAVGGGNATRKKLLLLARTRDKITARIPGTGTLITVFGR
jgi:hypothetical protein